MKGQEKPDIVGEWYVSVKTDEHHSSSSLLTSLVRPIGFVEHTKGVLRVTTLFDVNSQRPLDLEPLFLPARNLAARHFCTVQGVFL